MLHGQGITPMHILSMPSLLVGIIFVLSRPLFISGAANATNTSATNADANATDTATTTTGTNATTSRSWIDVIMPVEAIVVESDPFKDIMSIEVDPFRFTEMPSTEPSSMPTSQPSAPPTPSPTPRPTIWRENRVPKNADKSYFDYNPNKSSEYGPGQPETRVNGDLTRTIYRNNNWKDLKESAEEEYWEPFQRDIKFKLSENACGNSRQSPIDVWPSGAECLEHHMIRHRPGDFRIDGVHVKKQILPSKLRLLFPRREGEEPDPPFADFPNGWGASVDALHADIKIPSEHWIKGKQYVAEYQIFHLHRERDRAPVISIMIDLHPDGLPNLHLQRALDEFQQVFDSDERECEEHRRKARKLGGPATTSNSIPNNRTLNEFRRNAQETTEKKIWDPYHEELMPSIHFYGYSGSLTEPPCTEFIEWRVIDTPMLISPEQLLQMQTLLFNHVDNKCRLTSNHYEGSVARPIQDSNSRPVYQCTCRQFLADDDERRICSKREFRLQNEGVGE